MKESKELRFEQSLIDHLTQIGGTKQWRYIDSIKTTAQLWQNFKLILEKNNQQSLKVPLSDTEFAQVKNEIKNLKTPYQAGQFLYGLNGVSQVEVDLDDGRHVFLTVFDQAQVGAGTTTYQIVNQIERPAVLASKRDRRFDVSLLINGLPIIQIEEKADGHDAKEALRQMQQYIDEEQYTDIFSTVQILIGITPHNALYMANTNANMFNTDFAFHWQREEDNSPVYDWQEFSDKMLSIPMAHQMATNYMILDGTKNQQMVKVMRPYQVYATKRIIRKIQENAFGIDSEKGGYIWHTTGSGKTISSFKAAWLASRLPNVDKVIFVVDRIALTNQTAEKYAAYDPDSDEENKNGVVSDTANINVLARKLKTKSSGIIVTSVQKLDRLVQRESFKSPNKNVVFIVDEAHRSTSGEMLQRIKKGFKKALWFGYTGTPVFEGITTEQIFGDLLHAYTIREAIADGNVLGFKVDFNTTLPIEVLKKEYLPKYYAEKYPTWTQEQIEVKISNLSEEDMDDTVNTSVYDTNETHVKLVVDDIVSKWRNRSSDYRYNALLTTHVGGGKASTPMAMMYFDEFQRRNQELERPLKVAVTFSQDSSNGKNMLETNHGLRRAIDAYTAQFGGYYDDTNIKEYTESVVSRLDRTVDDGNYLDLVIVVDQLLTGFDAPKLNTLYVDRTLKGANLIQAYSRTNRIQDMQHKPFGRIINYRWPANSEKLMNEALTIYANRASADVQLTIDSVVDVLSPDFEELLSETQKVVEDLRELTSDFTKAPASEGECNEAYNQLKKYNADIAKLKQDDSYNYNDPEKLLTKLHIEPDQEVLLTTTLANEIKEKIVKKQPIDYSDLSLDMEHLREVEVNYDYLEELIAQLANEVHEGTGEADVTYSKVNKLVDQMDDLKYAQQIKRVSKDLHDNNVSPEIMPAYPVQSRDVNHLIEAHNQQTRRTEILGFRRKWGLIDIEGNRQVVNDLLKHHSLKSDDLDVEGQLTKILTEGQQYYREDAEDETVKKLSKIKYRNQLRSAFNKFADQIVEKY
ncbi:DEAD/DEAH box helicase [Loigolactobacillus backii]|uniref:Type I restriction enzyme endonuclease subunit n=1 Tax=Loigolactobacillus backii TaxID=375175 RepID=A0A192H430_9LACO|nr:HsdR family type I site-specific deoxyribonuclease [Loigolactobacillus backii]ANK63579.1 DEAD/DEAH box helicase [Loigolactobacillus backii]ANK70930.1 DEAD/DEAH box helicase [Loigolactobacillus backii]PIO83366.1 DEAD/DEAH box helicase [Loigolactobacillus backii]